MRLVLVTNRKLAPSGERFLDVVREAVAGGADAVVLREHDMAARDLLALALECKRIAQDGGAKFIVNHSLDVALAAEADGVHLGWRSLSAADARKAAPKGFLVGVSTHGSRDAVRVAEGPVDYIFLGPIFPTPSKAGRIEPLGTEAIRATKKSLAIPVIAIGGIKPENAAEVREAGADGIAVISAIMSADNPREAARTLRERMMHDA